MADDPQPEVTSPDRRPWVDRSREVARRARSRTASGSRRTWAWLVAGAQRLRPWLVLGSRRLWAWLVGIARRVNAAAREGPPPPPPEDPVERRELAGPITVPARGYVFAFTVRAAFTWSAQGLRPDQLAWYAHYFMPQATQRLTRIAADLARTVPPQRAVELEERLQRVLGRQEPWSFERGGRTVTCRPEAWVRLDERVRRALQPYWERLITLDCEYEEQTRRAQYAERINRQWAAILADLAGADVPEELRERLARAWEHTMAEQRAAAQWTGDLLRQRRRHLFFDPFTELNVPPKPAPTQPRAGRASDGRGRPPSPDHPTSPDRRVSPDSPTSPGRPTSPDAAGSPPNSEKG
ncbi:hypothetical protein ACTMS0_14475 [Micromonospora sp. H33]|uniref:hypothetical protein n=1 Tax=Micromonospora sp. H33 TaxID=3452215 RepID=UPI003F89EB9F